MNVITVSVRLFLLQKLPFSAFSFPHWQSVAAITLRAAMLVALAILQYQPDDRIFIPYWFMVLQGPILVWALFLTSFVFLRWWMKRKGRWDGQGDLFNLMAASWLSPSVLSLILALVGAPLSIITLLSFYSMWVEASALSAAVPRASFRYCMGGIILSALILHIPWSMVARAAIAVLKVIQP